jgi:hypothetical protein
LLIVARLELHCAGLKISGKLLNCLSGLLVRDHHCVTPVPLGTGEQLLGGLIVC